MIELLDYRIQQEELSSRIYKAMSIWLDYNGFSGAAKLWNKYSQEEQIHAEKVYQYLLDLDIIPTVQAIEKPSIREDFVAIIKQSHEHEIDITNQCKQLAISAQLENDYMTLELAQWFLKEQVEELAKTTYWLDRLSAFGSDSACLGLLDNEMDKQV